MKSILIVVPFENIFPPLNGGMMRNINLIEQLALKFKVTAIIYQSRESFLKSVQLYPAIQNCEIISTHETEKRADIFSLLPQKYQKAVRHRYWNRSLNGSAENNFLLVYPVVKKLLKQKKFDCAILEEISLLNIAKLIKRLSPQTRIIYDAHNVNSQLMETRLHLGGQLKKDFLRLKIMESNLSRFVDDVFTCSDSDFALLQQMNNNKLRGTTIPNGARLFNGGWKPNSKNEILFCGSLDYEPNREGLTWFCSEVFPLILKELPGARLIIIGKGDPGELLIKQLTQPAVVFYGWVENVSAYYESASVAIVPILSGSGTRLKLLEAMGYGIPVVSTQKGAEGVQYTENRDIIIANRAADFACSVIKILDNHGLASTIAENASKLIRDRYDWNIIGKKMQAYLEQE